MSPREAWSEKLLNLSTILNGQAGPSREDHRAHSIHSVYVILCTA
jgi:hypothetical protein